MLAAGKCFQRFYPAYRDICCVKRVIIYIFHTCSFKSHSVFVMTILFFFWLAQQSSAGYLRRVDVMTLPGEAALLRADS